MGSTIEKGASINKRSLVRTLGKGPTWLPKTDTDDQKDLLFRWLFNFSLKDLYCFILALATCRTKTGQHQLFIADWSKQPWVWNNGFDKPMDRWVSSRFLGVKVYFRCRVARSRYTFKANFIIAAHFSLELSTCPPAQKFTSWTLNPPFPTRRTEK